VKGRIRCMRDFKSFRSEAVNLSAGFEP
jgi:hypothetical protein